MFIYELNNYNKWKIIFVEEYINSYILIILSDYIGKGIDEPLL